MLGDTSCWNWIHACRACHLWVMTFGLWVTFGCLGYRRAFRGVAAETFAQDIGRTSSEQPLSRISFFFFYGFWACGGTAVAEWVGILEKRKTKQVFLMGSGRLQCEHAEFVVLLTKEGSLFSWVLDMNRECC